LIGPNKQIENYTMKASEKFERHRFKRWILSKNRPRLLTGGQQSARLAALAAALSLAAIALPVHAAIINTATLVPFNLAATESLEITDTGSITVTADNAVAPAASGITTGGITNAGEISTQQDGITIVGGSTVDGSITNALGGSITADDGGGNGQGIIIETDSTVTGDIDNAGTVTSGADSIIVVVGSRVDGNISNAGTLDAGSVGIDIFRGSSVGGNISNAAGGRIDAIKDGIGVVGGSTVTGDISNAGTISAGFDGIFVSDTAKVEGSVTNTVGAVIDTGQDGISITSTATVGAISNEGTITTAFDGIFVSDAAKVEGSITNAAGAFIDAGQDGISTTFSATVGDISNEGTITADFDGVFVDAGSTVNGTITNAVTGRIDVVDDGIDIGNSTVGGGISNLGIIASGDNAIDIGSTSTITGGINNAGTITAATASIDITAGSIVNGITNTGTLTGALRVAGESNSGAGIDLQNNGGRVDIGESESVISGDFSQDGSATLAITLRNFADYGDAALGIGDDAILDGLLDLSFITDFLLVGSERFTLIDIAGTLTGTFSNFDDNDVVATFGGIDLFIDYTDTGDVDLYSNAVPEPGGLTLLGLGGLGLIGRWRRKRLVQGTSE